MRARSLRCSLAAACLTFAGLVVPLSSVAEACSTAQHCFGQTTNVSTPSGFLGGRVSIGPYCLVAPRGAGSTDELWLADGSQYWVEAGFVDNEGYSPHLPNGRSLFWADNRPGLGYYEHPLATNPDLSTRTVSIQRTSTNTFTLHVGSATGYSTSNSMGVKQMTVGSEIMSNTGSHTWAIMGGIGWWRASGWVAGLPQPDDERSDSPNRWTWSTQFSVGHAGSAC